MLVEGVSPDGAVTLKNVESGGDETVEVIFKNASGGIGERLLFRSDEAKLKVVREDGGWRFDGDGARFRLAVEARRIGSAYLFDPLLAVHTSLVDPYPHQISAVYERMLTLSRRCDRSNPPGRTDGRGAGAKHLRDEPRRLETPRIRTRGEQLTYRKKLIEVALPLDEINAQCGLAGARGPSARRSCSGWLRSWALTSG